jgi:hypothetical protein
LREIYWVHFYCFFLWNVTNNVNLLPICLIIYVNVEPRFIKKKNINVLVKLFLTTGDSIKKKKGVFCLLIFGRYSVSHIFTEFRYDIIILYRVIRDRTLPTMWQNPCNRLYQKKVSFRYRRAITFFGSGKGVVKTLRLYVKSNSLDYVTDSDNSSTVK